MILQSVPPTLGRCFSSHLQKDNAESYKGHRRVCRSPSTPYMENENCLISPSYLHRLNYTKDGIFYFKTSNPISWSYKGFPLVFKIYQCLLNFLESWNLSSFTLVKWKVGGNCLECSVATAPSLYMYRGQTNFASSVSKWISYHIIKAITFIMIILVCPPDDVDIFSGIRGWRIIQATVHIWQHIHFFAVTKPKNGKHSCLWYKWHTKLPC